MWLPFELPATPLDTLTACYRDKLCITLLAARFVIPLYERVPPRLNLYSVEVGRLRPLARSARSCNHWMDMLARLSHRKARWLNLRVEHGLSMCDGQDALQIDLNFVDLSWCHMMTLCGKSILPVYRSLKGMLEQDIDHVSKLLSELDPLVEESEHHSRTEWGEPRGSPSIEPVIAPHGLHSSDPEQRRRKRRRSSTLQEPIVIRPTDTFAPTIIITPCPPQSRETSCWVPYQDASFGTRLTVPTYTALNTAHPPMVAPTDAVVIKFDDWEYINGHRRAVIPLPDEQCRRGMFSRTVLRRRRVRTDDLFL